MTTEEHQDFLVEKEIQSATKDLLIDICKANNIKGYSSLKVDDIKKLILENMVKSGIRPPTGSKHHLKRKLEIVQAEENKRKRKESKVHCALCGTVTTCLVPQCWRKHFPVEEIPKEQFAICPACLKSPREEEPLFMNHNTLLSKRVNNFPNKEHFKQGSRNIGYMYLYYPTKKEFCCK